MSKKTVDLLVIIFIILASTFFILKFNVPPLVSTIFYFIIPAVYLCLREKKNYKKISVASVIFGLICAFAFDFLATFNNAWVVHRLIFPWKILGVVPIDDMIWFFFLVFFIAVFYEHFLDDEKNPEISRHLKYALIPSILVFLTTIILFFISPNLLKFPYAYLILGSVAILPLFYILYRKPEFIHKFIKLGLFFSFVYLTFELTALKLGQWGFYGQYIGSVELFGLKFPFEELFFWIGLCAPTFISYYEIFVDDER
jgi:hypothetical protein